jgi:transposase
MTATTLEDRVRICVLAEAGRSDSEIATRLGLSVSTVRKWRRRGQREGLAGLVSQMGRPANGPMSSFSPLVQETVQVLRQQHSGWGALTLRLELEDEPSLAQQSLPGRSTIARWLKQQELTRDYERHQELPQPPPLAVQAPHELWELDARGHEKVPGVGVVTLINLADLFSRVKLQSYPCQLGEKRASRHPNTEDYQLIFRLTASEWGLPDRLAVDRDSVFYDNQSKSPFPTRFHLWLQALGVELVIGPPRQPTKRAMIERSHQTWAQQALVGQSFANWASLRCVLRQRRAFLNERLPCATLDNVPPLLAHPEARQPRRLYRPEWEEELLDLSRVYQYLSQGRWFRKGSDVGTVSLGRQIYVLGRRDWARKEVEITFDPQTQELLFYAPDGQKRQRMPLKGISKTDLMGELGPLVHLDHFQLALPFTWDEWRMICLFEHLSDTT